MRLVTAGVDVIDPGRQLPERPTGELEQSRVGGLLIGQASVVELLADPGGIAELGQAHHAGAALERVEGAAKNDELLEIGGGVGQLSACRTGRIDDLTGFLEEDLAHFLVLVDRQGRLDTMSASHQSRRL